MTKRKSRFNKILPGLIFFLVLILAGAIVSVRALEAFFSRNACFNINKVSIEGMEDGAYSEFKRGLLGKNIFLQNLGRLKKQIEDVSGLGECLFIQRKLPGELLFFLKKRIPVAQLKLSRFYLIDESAVIMPGASDLAFEGLPLILGLENRLTRPELKMAVRLVQEKNNFSSLNDCRITRISLSRQSASTFYITENFKQSDLLKSGAPKPQIEVKFDPGKPEETIKVLGLLLNKRKASHRESGLDLSLLENIEYIDLKNTDSPTLLEKK